MKLSQSQTAESELAIQSQIDEHRRQVEQRRREQELKERKEREAERKLRLKRLEDQKKEEERKKKREEEEVARQREMEKKEEQMRLALKYGPKRASAAGNGKGRSYDKFDVGEDDDSTFSALTREEKRERKLAAQLRRGSSTTSMSMSTSRRSGGSKGLTSLPDGRTVRRLPGGAVDVTVVSKLADPDAAGTGGGGAPTAESTSSKSVRERLAAMPATLMKLNTVKRDLRTIDEVMTERAKAKNKVLDGEEAKDFSDWFGKKKKTEVSSSGTAGLSKQSSTDSPSRALSTPPPRSPVPVPASVPTPAPGSSKPKSVTNNKPPSSTSTLKPNGSSGSFFKSINPKPAAVGTAPRPAASNTSLNDNKKRVRTRSPSPQAQAIKRRAIGASPSVGSSASASRLLGPSSSSATITKPSSTSTSSVRPIASSSSKSSKPPRSAPKDDMDPLDISNTIWSLFGKDKQRYAALDTLSDDEDMEADARSVLKEEARRFVYVLLFVVLHLNMVIEIF